MYRTLRRPMFRIGGSAEGITSGLTPRQGYKGLSSNEQLRKDWFNSPALQAKYPNANAYVNFVKSQGGVDDSYVGQRVTQ